MKNRVIWKMFALEIITLGIYRLYWLIKTRNEMVAVNDKVKIKSPWFLLMPIIVVIVAFGVMMLSLVFSNANTPRRCATKTNMNGPSLQTYSQDNYEIKCSDDGSSSLVIVSVVFSLIFYVGIFAAMIMFVIWLWGYCQAVEIITNEKLSFAICLVILILVPDGIDILIIQDAFNKVQPIKENPVSHNQALNSAA